MNWLKKISQKKPMALPAIAPQKARDFLRGVEQIDQVMSDETAQNEFNVDPQMEWLGAGYEGIVYRSSDKAIKYSKYRSEFENATFAFENQPDWIVPVLESPKQIQEQPFLCKIVMKRITKSTPEQEKLLDIICGYGRRQWLSKVKKEDDSILNELFTLFINRKEHEEEVKNIYYRVKYIFEQNMQTLQLQDLHADNFGWDEGVLKLLDLSF